jgi:hypothetical protein
MSKSAEKIEAIKLRKLGTSIKDIARVIKISRSSASVWCRDVVLTPRQKNLLLKKQIQSGQIGRLKGALVNKQKRLDKIDESLAEARRCVRKISNHDLLMLGIGLYWGEGIKSRSGPFSIINSDPSLLILGKKWMVDCMGVGEADFRPYVYIANTHKYRSKHIMSRWGNILNIPLSQFKTPIFIQQTHKKKYENSENYYGVVSLRVSRSTNLKYRVQALIKVISERI